MWLVVINNLSEIVIGVMVMFFFFGGGFRVGRWVEKKWPGKPIFTRTNLMMMAGALALLLIASYIV